MSLHSLIEPAGTLMTGWKLVPQRDCHAADVRNEDDIPLEVACAPAPAENAAEIKRDTTLESKWEMERTELARELREVG